MKPVIDRFHRRFALWHLVWQASLWVGTFGFAIGILLGLITGNPQAAGSVGGVIGLLVGAILGIEFTRRLSREVEKESKRPPGGWRRWDEDDDWGGLLSI